MATFGFGQSTGQIAQTAYVVRRIRPAIDWWINDGRAGPFFLLESFIEDVEAERVAYEARGYHVAFAAPVPSGGTVYYMGEGDGAPGFVELIPATPGMDEMFTRYWRASVDWDGNEPVRPFG